MKVCRNLRAEFVVLHAVPVPVWPAVWLGVVSGHKGHLGHLRDARDFTARYLRIILATGTALFSAAMLGSFGHIVDRRLGGPAGPVNVAPDQVRGSGVCRTR
ncbi:hypothetical protein CJJ17_26220 [Gordonia polyisoprenivorans]|nr:hypothetical protein CJJ17_26220 [Gordonia polyisoprenivorans]